MVVMVILMVVGIVCGTLSLADLCFRRGGIIGTLLGAEVVVGGMWLVAVVLRAYVEAMG